MSTEQTLGLVIVEESRNDADALANILRDAGFRTNTDFVSSAQELESLLENKIPQLVLIADGLEEFPLGQMMTTLRQKGITVPVVVISENGDEASIIEAMRGGATDLCSYDQPEHLQLVVKRELANIDLEQGTHNYEQRFRESEKRARMLMESSRDAIAYVHDGMHIFANSSYLEMFGFSDLEEIEGTPILDMVAPDQHTEFKNYLRNFGKNDEQEGKLQTSGQLPNGNVFEATMEFARASIDGEPCTQIIIRNQAASSKELEQKLKYLSSKDVLTGLFNRQYFIEELELAVTDAVTGSDTAAMVYMLMDNFKDIKDHVGIGVADMVISDIASLIKENTREEDVVARFGDHTFTILRRGCDAESVQALAATLRQTVEDHIADVEGQSVTTTCSIGMTLVTESTPSAHEVISRSDLACDVARSSGGNKVHMHNPVVDEKLGKERDQQIRSLIKDSLDSDQFRLLFQPVVSLTGASGEKYEVLLRMCDNDNELILPTQFLPIAEQTGQVADIDRWVVRQALQKLAESRSQGKDTQFFIKISANTLLDQELPLYINECLKEYRVQGDALIFEIAEKSASQHLKQAKFFINTVQKLRCRTALEHFGTSPNSFQLLKHLPVDFLKIDGSFIHNLASDNDNQAMVKSILETSRSMNKQCIAEYVQDAHSLAVLWQSGIDFIQGNFLQEPSEALSYDFSGEIA